MQTLESHLSELVASGEIAVDEARSGVALSERHRRTHGHSLSRAKMNHVETLSERRGRARDDAALARRLDQVERECAYLRERGDRSSAILDVHREMAATRDPELVVARLLRALRDCLCFSRAVYATVSRLGGVEARWQIDESDAVEPSEDRFEADAGSALVQVLRGEKLVTGFAGELSAPLVDVRGWYVLTALDTAAGPSAIVYADGHPSALALRWEASMVRNVASVAAVAIESATLLARTQELAARDPLTGLYNRRALNERLEHYMQRARRVGTQVAYVLIDIDDFKNVNDRHGHASGDDMLNRVAATLRRSCRSADIAARYAGDEFCVVLGDIDAELARSLVARLSSELRAQDLRCSLGVALYPRDARDERSLVEAADRALYNTKRAGKNGFSFY